MRVGKRYMRLAVSYGQLEPLGETEAAPRRRRRRRGVVWEPSKQERAREAERAFRAILDQLTPFCSALAPIDVTKDAGGFLRLARMRPAPARTRKAS